MSIVSGMPEEAVMTLSLFNPRAFYRPSTEESQNDPVTWESPAILDGRFLVVQKFIQVHERVWRTMDESLDPAWGSKKINGVVTAWRLDY